MKREKFVKVENNYLEIRDYEKEHIKDYLKLLDESMDFTIPPPTFIANKEYFQTKFNQCRIEKSFESFWMGTELIGLYWRKGYEIEIMAVSKKYQRKGFGSIILSRAIECCLNNTDDHYAYLYCVDWNEKGQRFYKKFGMEINGHSYCLSIG
jgi:GNAT superfamily N-acetyltransferase